MSRERLGVNYSELGKLAEAITVKVIRLIQAARKENKFTVHEESNPYVMGGKSISTTVDIAAQREYTNVFSVKTPDIGIVAEEKDPLRSFAVSNKSTVWLIDGVDGTTNLVGGALFGYGTQCALLQGKNVPIAIVGDASTGDIFGYYGNSGVFRIDKYGKRSQIGRVARERRLADHSGLRRPTIDLYHPLSQKLLLSGEVGNVQELVGGIGTTMAQLLTDQIGLFALRPHHERPWDAVPAYALCAKADMVFMTPTKNGKSFQRWHPTHLKTTYMRTVDLLVMHRSRVREFMEVVERHA